MPRILKILGYPHDTKYHALCRRANEHTDRPNILPQNNKPVKKPKNGLTLCFTMPEKMDLQCLGQKHHGRAGVGYLCF